MKANEFPGISYLRHEQNWAKDLRDRSRRKVLESWFREDTADFWRHLRMYEPVFEILSHETESKWLTVGDGRFGLDAIRMRRRGFSNVTASDISDELLSISFDAGLLSAISKQNAEALSFSEDSFDFVLCKESFHHFPRPYLALYEMLRVASSAVIIVEPQDPFIDLPLVRGVRVPSYEQDDNNFVYGISFAELTKVGYATNMPAVSYKTFNDFYKPGLEFSVARDGDKEFDMLKEVINQLNLRVAQGLSKNNMAMAILWNRVPTSHELEKLARHGWLTTNTNTNPYVNRENSYSAHFKLGYDAEGQIVLSESYSGD